MTPNMSDTDRGAPNYRPGYRARLDVCLHRRAIALSAGCSSTTADRQDPAASLAGLRLEVPCANPKFNNDTECHWDQGLLQTADPQWKLKREIVRTFGGRNGIVYDVTLHVRGVVEPKNFTGGTVQFEHFQTGGTPVKNDYNFYSLHVSDPEATYTFNRNEQKVGHYTFPIDYRVTHSDSQRRYGHHGGVRLQ